MLFTSLHFSSIIYHSCMVATNCNSCWRIVSVFASHRYRFCVVTKLPCVQRLQTMHTKIRNIIGKTLIATSCFKIQENLLAVDLMLNAL